MQGNPSSKLLETFWPRPLAVQWEEKGESIFPGEWQWYSRSQEGSDREPTGRRTGWAGQASSPHLRGSQGSPSSEVRTTGPKAWGLALVGWEVERLLRGRVLTLPLPSL